MTWKTGDVVMLRWRRKQPLDVAIPVRIIEDSAERTILYTAVGTPMKVEATASGEPISRGAGTFVERQTMCAGYADYTWHTNHTLMVAWPDSIISVWLFYREQDHMFSGYYVNLQQPLQRTGAGFDTADYVLDLVVKPDFSWEYKDEDEFADLRAHHLLPEELLNAIQLAGKQAERMIAERAFPFDAGWENWKPDPEWAAPEMPANWADGIDLSGHTIF